MLESFPETIPAHFRGLGISGENKCFDVVLMGRRTYEAGLKYGVTEELGLKPRPYRTALPIWVRIC